MGLTLRHEVHSLALRDPFRIARSEPGAGSRITTVLVELRDDRFPELVGLGEGYPDHFYGETPETMVALFPMLLEAVGSFEPTADGLIDAELRMAVWEAVADAGLPRQLGEEIVLG